MMNAAVRCMGRLAAAYTLWMALTGCTLPAAEGFATPLAPQTRGSDRLYFGRMHAAGVVTHAEWEQFLAEVVTPRFPEGLTVWTADGQWRDGGRRVTIREPTFVLEVVHPHHAS